MALRFWLCAGTLLVGFGSAQSDTTPEKPLILNDDTTPEKPLILNDDTTPEKPLILNDDEGEFHPLPTRPTFDELRFLKEKNQFELTNPTHVNGEELYESDMLLTPEQRQLKFQRKAVADIRYRWTNSLVPYMFEDTSVNQAAVRAAIAHWEQHTCIRFTPATNLTLPHLRFFLGSGCWSYVGMIYYWTTGQQVSIGSGCTSLGTVAHEIGHALGFFHEQSRSDRDAHVHINLANVISGYENNFNIQVDNNYSVPYDYTSDMHYGDAYFTKNGLPTIATVNPFAQELIGQRSALSHFDKLLANKMYSCIANWLTACGRTSDPCQNYGYLGANCSCICPAGTSGVNCEIITGDYYNSFLSGCSANVTTEGNITSPNYPNNYPSGVKCVKVIRAPSDCYTIELRFNDFKLYQQNSYCNNNLCCYFDYLEIRTADPFLGSVYCDTMITAGQTFTSTSGQIILIFKTGTNLHKGWSASVSFIPSASCTSTSSISTTSTTTTTPTTSTTTTTPTTTTTTTTPTTTSTTTTPTTTTTTTTPTTTTTTTTTSTTTTTPTTTTTTTPTTTTTTPPTTTTTTTPTTTTTTTPTTTTTTTPTTTTSTTPTTATTTTPTTTTTTTPTTTTTTTPTTTTTTPTTTTTTSSITTTPICNESTLPSTATPPPQGSCSLLAALFGGFRWKSPGYPRNYPNNAHCSFTRSSSAPKWAQVNLNRFALQSPAAGVCSDYVSFSRVYNMSDVTLCGKMVGTFNLPTYNFDGNFHSNSAINAGGFDITVTPKSSKCHKLITTGGVGSTGIITSVINNISWMKTGCEWWIVGPPCSRIQLEFITTNMNGICAKNAVILNGLGDKTYPQMGSEIYCGTPNPPTVTSDVNALYVLYYSAVTNSPFTARWTVL